MGVSRNPTRKELGDLDALELAASHLKEIVPRIQVFALYVRLPRPEWIPSDQSSSDKKGISDKPQLTSKEDTLLHFVHRTYNDFFRSQEGAAGSLNLNLTQFH